MSVKDLVDKLGQGKIRFIHSSQNLGLLDSWNKCINISTGKWVHILHQDDIALPGFYRSIRNGIVQNENIGALFCRHLFIDEFDCKPHGQHCYDWANACKRENSKSINCRNSVAQA